MMWSPIHTHVHVACKQNLKHLDEKDTGWVVGGVASAPHTTEPAQVSAIPLLRG